MSKAVNAAGKLLKWTIGCGAVVWLGYESLYNSKLLFCVLVTT